MTALYLLLQLTRHVVVHLLLLGGLGLLLLQLTLQSHNLIVALLACVVHHATLALQLQLLHLRNRQLVLRLQLVVAVLFHFQLVLQLRVLLFQRVERRREH